MQQKKSWIIVCPGARETVLGFSDVTKQREVLVAEAEDVLEDIQRRISFEGTGQKIGSIIADRKG